MAARLQNVQFGEASVPAGLGPTCAHNQAARRALFTVFAVRSAVHRPPRERANPRANADRLQATPSDARRLSSLVKCPLSDTEPRPATPGRGLGVKGSPVQIRPSRRFFEHLYPEMGTKTAMIIPT